MSVAAMLSGCQSLSAIAQWGREVVKPDRSFFSRFGFTSSTSPVVSTSHEIFKTIDVESFERVFLAWQPPFSTGCYAITGLSAQRAPPHGCRACGAAIGASKTVFTMFAMSRSGKTPAESARRSAPQLLAAMRNALRCLLRDKKVPNRAAAIRPFSWNRQKAAAAVGVPSLT